MHMCLEDGGSTQRSLCVCVCGLEAAEQTCMCEALSDTASLRASAFVSLNSLFLTVFYYCCFLILFEYFWFLRTEIILIAVPVVSFLSSLILLNFLAHLSLTPSSFPIFFVLALVMREAGTQELKFSCNRVVLSKLCCILKMIF